MRIKPLLALIPVSGEPARWSSEKQKRDGEVLPLKEGSFDRIQIECVDQVADDSQSNNHRQNITKSAFLLQILKFWHDCEGFLKQIPTTYWPMKSEASVKRNDEQIFFHKISRWHPLTTNIKTAQGRESGCVILATPDNHSSRGVENPKIYQHPVLRNSFRSFPIIARVLVRRLKTE